MAQEIELKLGFQNDQLAQIVAHPLVVAGAPLGLAKTLDNTYFDTPDLALHAARVAIRIRRTGSGIVQTVKCAAASYGGLSSRPEWEQPYAGQFDFSAIDDPSVRALLGDLAPRLQPVFSTVFERTTRRFTPRPGVVILMMIDSGQVRAVGREAAIAELELELVAGEADDVQQFAIQLAENLPLLPVDRSKAERGYRLFLGQDEGPVKSLPPPVTGDLSPATAFIALARPLQAAWQANQFGMLASPAPEYVHQFRVALRRLNTLLKVFAPRLAAAPTQRWIAELKTLASQAGDARDLDVMLTSILRPLRATKLAKAERALVDRVIRAGKKARQAAGKDRDALASGAPLLRFARDIEQLPEAADEHGLAGFAERRLTRLHGRAVKRLKVVRKLPTADNAHRLRIALKHLRYGCEFFSALFEQAAMQQFAQEVAALQDELGLANDLHAALARLAQWAVTDPALAGAAEFIAGRYAGQLEQRLAAAVDPAERLLTACPPWCGACARHGRSHRKRKAGG